jgi:putative acetyltransferase
MSDCTPAGFRVRLATPADAAAIWPVHVASIREVCAGAYTPEQIEAWAGPKRPENYVRAMDRGEQLWVAEDDSRWIVGFARLDRDVLMGLYVAPAALRRGIGSALLRAAEAHALASGVETLRLNATLNAVAFYASQGYVAGERISRAMGGVDVPSIRMSKRLRLAPEPPPLNPPPPAPA